MIKGLLKDWPIVLAIYTGYSLLWYLGWQLSVNFEIIASVATWFLPAGIRVAALLLFNKKFWPVIAVAEFTGIFAINSFESPYKTFIGEAVGTFLPILIYMFAIHCYLKSFNSIQFNSVRNTISLFIWSFTGAMLTATVLISSMVFQGNIDVNDFK